MSENQLSSEKIINLYEVLGNGKLVAEELHHSYRTVYRVLKQAGLIEPRQLKEKVVVDGIEFTEDSLGYMRATKKKHRTNTTTMRLHRLIASKAEPVQGKDVHHENQDKKDNRPENLKPLKRSDHIHGHKVAQDGHAFS